MDNFHPSCSFIESIEKILNNKKGKIHMIQELRHKSEETAQFDSPEHHQPSAKEVLNMIK